MKTLIATVACFLLVTNTQAQITLTASDFTSAAGTTDTLLRIVAGTIPAQTEGADQTWDFSGVSYDSMIYLGHAAVSASASFPTAQFADTLEDSTGFTYYYGEEQMRAVDTSAISRFGEHIDRQGLWLSAVTSVISTETTDSFVLQYQDAVYTKTWRDLVFPAGYGNTWMDTFSESLNATATIAAASYDNAPAMIDRVFTVKDTVTGWGMLKLKNSSGVMFTVPVLQVKSSIYYTEATLIDGTEIDESLHDLTELSRFGACAVIQYAYYMKGSITPLATVWEETPETPSTARMLNKASYPTEGVATVQQQTTVQVYPNPIAGRTVYINVPEKNEPAQYQLLDGQGKCVAKGTIQGGGQMRIQLNKTIAAGTYYLALIQNGKTIDKQNLTIE